MSAREIIVYVVVAVLLITAVGIWLYIEKKGGGK